MSPSDPSTPDPLSKPSLLLLGTITHSLPLWTTTITPHLTATLTPTSTTRPAFLSECRAGAFDRCIAIYRTFHSAAITGPFDAPLIAALPASVKFIVHNGAGYDSIDVAACTARGIRVGNVVSAVDDATADAGVWLMLGALRGFGRGVKAVGEGRWDEGVKVGRDPGGKVLGVLGMGGIGANMARKCRAFGMRVVYHNRGRLSGEEEMDVGAEYVSFEDLLKLSDVLSLNLPLNDKTRHIISAPEFAKMKRGVVIVNTARGAVIDENALVEALELGQVGSVGLDVFENEPNVHPGLMKNPRALLLPHMGTSTIETEIKMEEWSIGNIRSVLETGKLRNVVPEQRDMQ